MTAEIFEFGDGIDPVMDSLYEKIINQIVGHREDFPTFTHEQLIGLLETIKMDIHLSVRTDIFEGGE